MKNILTVLMAATILLIGCDTSFDPVSSNKNSELQKPKSPLSGSGYPEMTYELVPLPVRSPIYLDSVFTITGTIVGEVGGRLLLDRSYVSENGQLITMLVDMVIPPNSFPGKRRITLTVDKEFAVVHCLPSMEFKFPLTLVQTFTGLDLQDFQSEQEDFDFVYIKKNGDIEEVERTSIIVNKSLGILTVLDAKLEHFSKFGWVRKHNNGN